jgi:hypothetical protein
VYREREIEIEIESVGGAGAMGVRLDKKSYREGRKKLHKIYCDMNAMQ